MEGKQLERKSQHSDILSGTPYKQLTVSKGKEKASKSKGRAERQLKYWKQRRKKLKIRWAEKK
jgi:hypothetical protein